MQGKKCEVIHQVSPKSASWSLDYNVWGDVLRARPEAPITEAKILEWVDGPLRAFFPFEAFFCSYGDYTAGKVKISRALTLGYSKEFLQHIKTRFDMEDRGCFAWWIKHQKPFILDPSSPPPFATKLEVDELLFAKVGVLAGHGVADPSANVGTYVSFAGIPRLADASTREALEIIAPVLHALFMNSLGRPQSKVDMSKLTFRQREILDLVIENYDDKTIAQKLGLSEHTVGNHLRAIFSRLEVNKRIELIGLFR